MAMSDGEVGKDEVLSSEMQNGDNGASTDIASNPKETATAGADQLSQSLAEDESVSHSIKSAKSTGMFLSSSESAFSSTSTAVTPERKQVLLAQARADRLDWIRRVPLPYKCEGKASRNDASGTLYEDVWQRDPRLAELKNTFVFQQSPSALQVLSHLYGIGREPEASENNSTNGDLESVSKRVGEILDQVNEADGDDDGKKLAAPTAEQIRNTALAEEDGDPVLRAFNSWASKLSDPAAAVLVQGMRGFCRKIRSETLETLPPKLQGYLRLTLESLKEYAPWKETDIGEDTRRSLESFVYGHIDDYLDHLYWTDEVKEEEKNWQHRLGALQFVNPKHLEIHCLAEGTDVYKDIFREPVEALLSVEKYYSPFEKLQRILAVYHTVNAALTEALNRSNDSATKKLPSADDVLPSIILTVLIARPSRLLLDLQLIEDFAPPEYLRGEAGYAYTNLYGAVQFLKDIDLDADKPESLDIDAEEFRSSLKACREATEAKHAQRKSITVDLDATEPEPLALAMEETVIPVADIRDARMRGQVVDIEWAKRRLLEKAGEGGPEETNGAEDRKEKDDPDELPSGFNRSYTFLSSRPEDIKLSDLPKLLAEYKMLVHTTESLLGEKIAKANAEKKAKLAARKKEVYEAAKQIDPSLLPAASSSSKRR